MSFFDWFKREAAIVEADVQKIVAALINGEKVAIADLQKGLTFVAQEAPTAVSALANMAAFATAVAPVAGAAAPEVATIAAALTTAQGVVSSLQSYATKYSAAMSGGITSTVAAQAVVDGYSTLNQAKAAIAQLGVHVTAQAKAS